MQALMLGDAGGPFSVPVALASGQSCNGNYDGVFNGNVTVSAGQNCVFTSPCIDYAQSAHDAGLQLDPLVLIFFGNPKAGTPLMTQSPRIGIDLPLKFVVWQDGSGKVFSL